MDNEPEVIRQQMEETRTSLTDKVERLEQQVTGTVQDATSAVSGTVESVKDAVQETVATVKDTVHDTVESVKEAFDLRRQVDHHPWLMMGLSAGAGFLSSRLLGRATRHDGYRAEGRQRWLSSERRDWPTGYHVEPQSTAEERLSPPRRAWFSFLAPELEKFKGMAIGYAMGAVRDVMSQSLPADMRPQIKETMDSLTQKLGGQPVHGPVLGGAHEDATSEGAFGHDEARTSHSSFTDIPGRW
jgi:ElaB/YqjD/DUF883 family membrane-anchored ribosome-binding protein